MWDSRTSLFENFIYQILRKYDQNDIRYQLKLKLHGHKQSVTDARKANNYTKMFGYNRRL